jgi:inorganic triphosphatase YgiF
MDDIPAVLSQFDELLGRLERTGGPTAAAALDGIAILAQLYGEALARILCRVSTRTRQQLADDELVGHLMLLHGLHPEPTEARIRAALADVAAELGERGDAELEALSSELARVRVTSTGCGSQAGQLSDAVRQIVLAAAPELREVEVTVDRPRQATPVIPVESLRVRHAAAGVGG